MNGQLVHDGVLAPGMLRLCDPQNTEQRMVRKPVKVMVFTLPFERVQSLCTSRNCLSPSVAYPSPFRVIRHRLVQQLTATAMLADELTAEARSVFIGGIAEALVALLFDDHGKAGEADRRGLSTRQLLECVSFADAHLGQKLSLPDWAEVVHLSASEFGRRFHVSTKLTPYAWYINRRIERAQEMLQRRSTVISDLALALGFASQSHFTEAFRRRTGMSPARWRSLRRDFDSVAVS